jgi:predicted DNA-binding protein
MKPAKAMTIRLSAEQAEALETVASVESRPVAEVIRAAIEDHIQSRRRDPTFQDSLKDRIQRTQRMLRNDLSRSGVFAEVGLASPRRHGDSNLAAPSNCAIAQGVTWRVSFEVISRALRLHRAA